MPGIPNADRGHTSVTTMADCASGIIDLAVRGRWRQHLAQQAHQAITSCLAGHSGGIVLDLHHLDDPHAASIALWRSAHAHGAAQHPPIPVLATLPATTVLATTLTRPGARRHLPVVASIADAHTTLTAQPPPERLRISLAPEPAAAATARETVTTACRQWQLTTLIHTARLVLTELVSNATDHAGTPLDVTISRLGTGRHAPGLHLAVYDRDPRLPPRPTTGTTTAPQHDHRLGLRVVDAAAHAWGTLPTRTGKMVWATLHPPPHQP